jgi:AAA-like domain
MNDNSVKKILILAANPIDSVRLSLEREVAEIRTTLQLSANRDRFTIEARGAVRPGDLQMYMYDLNPQIVHFSGHGVGTSRDEPIITRKFTVITDTPPEGLMFEDEDGRAKLVSGAAISNLCALFADQVVCVVLNACYSAQQAEEIVKYIPYVVGMNQAIGDIAARKFSEGFYRAIWDVRSIEEAFASGKNAIELDGIPEELTPVLLTRQVAPLVIPVGTDDLFYVASPYEDRCNQEVKKPGSLIRIKSPHKMGKSLLMARLLTDADKQGYRTVTIDLARTNQSFFADLDRFMQWFCASVGKALGIRVKKEEYWDDIFGANDNSTDYFENYLLNGDDSPLILAIDNFDQVFQYANIETDFCGLLRGWHERSKTKKQWEQLRLIVVHSQESYAQMDINQSPFNVGLPIELGEFTPTQVGELVARHGLNWNGGDLDRFVALIGGYPYLVRSALYSLASGDFSLAEFLKTAPTEAGIYSDLLRGYLKILEDYPGLGTAMKKVVVADSPVNLRSEEAFKLDSMGLVVRVENNVIPRCNLYRQYFRERLGAQA